jgi:hypothetical protein
MRADGGIAFAPARGCGPGYREDVVETGEFVFNGDLAAGNGRAARIDDENAVIPHRCIAQAFGVGNAFCAR